MSSKSSLKNKKQDHGPAFLFPAMGCLGFLCQCNPTRLERSQSLLAPHIYSKGKDRPYQQLRLPG